MHRRSFVAGMGAAGIGGLWLPAAARAELPLADDPFALGVASGRPMPGSVVLWTRLIAAGEPGEQLSAPIPVDWAIAEDEAMQRIVGRGQAIAEARWAHSVHVEAGDLKPSRPYWYRFTVRGKASPVARTRTAPDASERLAALRFVFASCQQYEQGYYTAFRHMAAEDAAFVLHLGDYIYEKSWGRELVRHHEGGRTTTLDEYRNRYAQYKSDRDLQAAHAAFPWIVTWDDHEVDDDYTDDISPQEPSRERFLAQRAAAYQAFWEHMPLPLSFRPQGPSLRLYDRYRFGDLAELYVLDERQYRSHHACRAALPRNKVMRECAERLEPARTMLGAAQETWLADGLARGSTRWNVIAQQTLMAQVDRGEGEHRAFWHDGWDGYAPARQRLLDAVAASSVRDTLVASGDVHSFWAADLKRNFDAADAPTIATKFVGGSITSQGPSPARVKALLARNPDLRYGLGGRHGYTQVALAPKAATVSFRVVDTVKEPTSGIATIQSFTVEAGRPGVSAP
ncbi:alkaline phosphatase D family protein [Reyranella sp.]|uniref:alkaline phosphatase D family protein n=1 Tax=Reyranella sp. TaxID=1929291 RepID=UPI0012050442|nr:alkaline phosphatase D family protein [Reyranella sp.]TAJ88067.1 MAG: alkaline phosphatase [Reyranella sp.]